MQRAFTITEMAVTLAAIAALVVVVAGGARMIERSALAQIIRDIATISQVAKQYKQRVGHYPNSESDWHAMKQSGKLQDISVEQGVVKSPIEGGFFHIRGGQLLILTLASADKDTGVLTGEAIAYLDNQIDDGHPFYGRIRVDADTPCVQSNTERYKQHNDQDKCIMHVVLEADQGLSAVGGAGACKQVGHMREISDPAVRCPKGRIGKMMEICSGNDTTEQFTYWKQLAGSCMQPVMCHDGVNRYAPGQTMTQTCPGDASLGYVLECTEYGVWRRPKEDLEAGCDMITCPGGFLVGMMGSLGAEHCPSGYKGRTRLEDARAAVTTMCAPDGTWQVIGNECAPQYGSCQASIHDQRDIGCPKGEVGRHVQQCVDHGGQDYWMTLYDHCQPALCDGLPVGFMIKDEQASCPNGSTGYVGRVCHDDGVWHTTYHYCHDA